MTELQQIVFRILKFFAVSIGSFHANEKPTGFPLKHTRLRRCRRDVPRIKRAGGDRIMIVRRKTCAASSP